MKIKQLLLVSLLGLPLIACGCSKDKDAIYKVKEEEFFKAIQFTDETYLQIDKIDNDSYRGSRLYAPNAYHASSYLSSGQIDHEMKIFKKGESYIEYEDCHRGQGWLKDDNPDPDDFESIETKAEEIMVLFDNTQPFYLTYDDFSFDSETKTYVASTNVPDSNESTLVYFYFKFENKKCIEGSHTEKGGLEKEEYRYDKIEIEEPVVPPSKNI